LPHRPASGVAAERAKLRRQQILQSIAATRAQAQAVADGIAETVALDQARGAVFERPARRRGEGSQPFKRLDGLNWLAARGRLNGKQVQAGLRYGKLAQIIEGGDIGSCLTRFEIRGSLRGASPTDARIWARDQLAQARAAVGDHPGLVFALDQICALGRRPREVTTDQRASERLEDRLSLSLDLLVKAWGL
jgi:hypothetical protein